MSKLCLVIACLLTLLVKAKGEWNIVRLDALGDVGMYASITRAHQGSEPCVSYYDATHGDLKLLFWKGWYGEILKLDTTGKVGMYTYISSKGDTLWISYYDATNGNLKCAFYDIRADTFAIHNIDTLGDVGMYTSNYIDLRGYLHISYYDATNKDLKYAKLDTSGWTIQVIDTSGDVGKYSSISANSGYIYISYYDSTNGDLKFAQWDRTQWNIQKVNTLGDVGKYTSIYGSSASYYRITYYDATNGDLKSARRWNNTWHISTLDSTGDVGLFSSICKDPSGGSFVVYYDKTNGDLKETYGKIDSVGDVGGYCSAVGPGGCCARFIVYYDFTNKDLKMAWGNGAVEEGSLLPSRTSFYVYLTLTQGVKIFYTVPYSACVTLDVYNIVGQKVSNLVNERKERGDYHLVWDPVELSNGLYLLNLQVGNFSDTKKIALIK